VSLNFPRALTQSEAEEVMMLFARGFAATIETELCGGHLPFDNMGLHQRITDVVKVIPQHRVRVSGLHVLRDEAVPSTEKPSSSTNPSLGPAPPSSWRGSSLPAPSGWPGNSVHTSTVPPVSGFASAYSAPPSERTSQAPRSLETPHAAHASGTVPRVTQRAARTESGFVNAASAPVAEMRSEAVGRTLASALRGAAASLLLAALDATHDFIDDPLRFLDGRVDRELRSALIKEAYACVAYVLHDALSRAGVPQTLAAEVVQCAGRHAATSDAFPSGEINRYLALGNTRGARDEFSTRVCALLGVPEPADMAVRIDLTLRGIQRDVALCSERICERLLRTG
jgi:hypothetical protein